MRETWFSAAHHKADTGAGADLGFGAGRFMGGFPGAEQPPFGASGLLPWDFQIPSPILPTTPAPAVQQIAAAPAAVNAGQSSPGSPEWWRMVKTSNQWDPGGGR